MSITVPFPGLVDIRQPILGDSFGWAGLEPTAAKKSILIHHSAGPTTQDGFDIAAYHVNSNGWGGIGYHIVITHDDYPGRVNFAPPGAQVQYVGDLDTWRAHAENANPGRVGICLVGNFVNGVPGRRQLELARQLVDFFIAPNNILPSINYYSQITGHGLLQGQSTACPGYANANFTAWYDYVRGGAFPDHLYNPITQPVPDPPLPPVVPIPPVEPASETPVVPDITPGKGGDEVIPPELTNWQPNREDKVILTDGAVGINTITGEVLEGTRPRAVVGTVFESAGYFTRNADGKTYARSVYSKTQGIWNGLDVTYFNEPTGQPSGDIPIRVSPPLTPQIDPTAVATDVTDEQLTAATVPETSKLSWLNWLKEFIASILAGLLKKGSK